MQLLIRFGNLAILLFVSVSIFSQKKPAATKDSSKDKLESSLFSGLQFRSVGPAITSGRIGDLAVNPANHSEYYVAVASGGVWKTKNAGITFIPVFDGE